MFQLLILRLSNEAVCVNIMLTYLLADMRLTLNGLWGRFFEKRLPETARIVLRTVFFPFLRRRGTPPDGRLR